MEETRRVTYKQLEIGQQISGTIHGGMSESFRAYVKEINAAYVTVEMWEPGGRQEQISSEAWFLIALTDDEIRDKYNEKAAEIIRNVQKPLHLDEIGSHTQANAWISSNPWELAMECGKRNYTILGHCKDIMPKRSFLGGTLLDVGICALDKDGDRFWCHFSSQYIEVLARRYERYQTWKRESGEDFNFILNEIPYEVEMETLAHEKEKMPEQQVDE